MSRLVPLVPLHAAALLLAGCAAAPPVWSNDAAAELAAARREGRDLAVFFALPGRDASDRMERAALRAPAVEQALADGGFRALRLDGFAHRKLYERWIRGGEGMGIAVLDPRGDVSAARPGPQDPPELAAFLRLCARERAALAAARAAHAANPDDPIAQHRLGALLLELGVRVQVEELLTSAAQGGVADAWHRLARLHALDGDVTAARRWLRNAPRTPAARVTEGYLLFKERRHAEAAAVLDAAVRDGDLGSDRQRALLFLGKSLHEQRRDAEALPVLDALAREGTGSTFEAAARHTIAHIHDPTHGHAH